MRFKNILLFALSFISIINFSITAQSSSVNKGVKVITPEKIKTHIGFLASDALLGRNTPSPGLDSAAAYITREFIKDGLQPVNGSYFNPVPLATTALGEDNYVEINNKGDIRNLIIKTEFVPFENTASGTVEGSVVFAGYGITAPELNYDNYAGINASGKIVVVMKHYPREQNPTSSFKDNTRYTSIDYKMENAISHGAIGAIVVTDPLNHIMLTPRGFPWPSLYTNFPQDALPLGLKDTRKKRIPFINAGTELIVTLFGSVDSLKNLQAEMDRTLKPFSKDFSYISVKLKVSIIENQMKTGNIVGLLPGTDPVLKNELIVVGAHYDHVGYMKKHKEGENYIYNGADDNASGTSGLLAITEAFSKAGVKPKRSILFIAFTAEEKGLFGSKAYVENPLFPLDKTVAMVNMDMIGRGHPDTLHLEAGNLSPDLTKIVESENKDIAFKIQVDGTEFLDRSDQSNFYHHNVPFIMFFAGLHNDYHTVRDRPEAIDFNKAARIAKLAFKTTWIIANDNNHYKLIDSK